MREPLSQKMSLPFKGSCLTCSGRFESGWSQSGCWNPFMIFGAVQSRAQLNKRCTKQVRAGWRHKRTIRMLVVPTS